MIFKGKLIDLVFQINEFTWNLWIYAEPYEYLSTETQCAVLDVDKADLGADGFTPIEIEKIGYIELISMQDLQVITGRVSKKWGGFDSAKIIEAINYYIVNDAYLY